MTKACNKFEAPPGGGYICYTCGLEWQRHTRAAIELEQILEGDEVIIEDDRRNTAKGSVGFIASDKRRGAELDTMALAVFGVLIPFAKRSRQGSWSHTGGNKVIGHQPDMFRS